MSSSSFHTFVSFFFWPRQTSEQTLQSSSIEETESSWGLLPGHTTASWVCKDSLKRIKLVNYTARAGLSAWTHGQFLWLFGWTPHFVSLLVRAALRDVTHRGSDVRLTTGELTIPNRKPICDAGVLCSVSSDHSSTQNDSKHI